MAGSSKGKGKGLQPVSAQEWQAATTLRSAREVVSEIEEIKKRLTVRPLSAADRRLYNRQLYECSERLCNLMALTIYQLSSNLSGDFQVKLRDAIHELRGRLLDMGTHLMIERVEKIQRRAEQVLGGGEYPLGLASKLEITYAGIVSNLDLLGATSRLSAEEKALIDETGAAIKALVQIEAHLGVLEPLAEDTPQMV